MKLLELEVSLALVLGLDVHVGPLPVFRNQEDYQNGQNDDEDYDQVEEVLEARLFDPQLELLMENFLFVGFNHQLKAEGFLCLKRSLNRELLQLDQLHLESNLGEILIDLKDHLVNLVSPFLHYLKYSFEILLVTLQREYALHVQ